MNLQSLGIKWSWGLDGCARWRKVTITVAANWYGWLRAVAQGYSYSWNKIDLGSNSQNNLKSCRLNLGWVLDGCARRRKVTITNTSTITIKLNCCVIFI